MTNDERMSNDEVRVPSGSSPNSSFVLRPAMADLRHSFVIGYSSRRGESSTFVICTAPIRSCLWITD